MSTHTTGASYRRIATTLFTLAGALMLAVTGLAPLSAQEDQPTQDAQEIDLETAVAMALQNNLGIENELLSLMQKKLIADTWWNRFYPSLNARATMRRANEAQVSGAGTPFAQELPRWGLSTAVEARLDLTLQMVPGIRLAALDYESGKITMSQARREVERDVTKQFYELLLLKEQITLSRQQIDTAERRYNQAQTNYENGLADEYTMLSARVAWENQKPQLTGLQVQYQQGLLLFRNGLGVELTRNVQPSGRIDPPSLVLGLRDITRDLLSDRLDLRQLQAMQAILEQQYALTDAGRAPVLSFGWSYDPTFGGDPLEDDIFDGDRWDQRTGAFTVTITQPLDPWLPYSQTRNNLADMKRQQQQNQIRQQQALNGGEIEVRSLIRGIEAAEETVAALEFNIELAQRAFELAEIGYQNGLRDLLEVQNAEVELQSARFELLKQRKQIMDNLLDLEFALNTTIDEITE